MKKCPVCAVDVEDNAPFCNICGVNLAGAKDVGPSEVETPVSKSEGKPAATSASPLIKTKSSFYLPAFQFLIAVALLGLILYYTTGDIPHITDTAPESNSEWEVNMTAEEKAKLELIGWTDDLDAYVAASAQSMADPKVQQNFADGNIAVHGRIITKRLV